MDDANIINTIHSASNDLGARIERSLDAQTKCTEKDFGTLNDSLVAINTSIKDNNEALTGIKEKIIAHLGWFIVLVVTAMGALGLQVWDRWPF